MTVKEAYEIWLSNYNLVKCGSSCIFGAIEDGPGFREFAGCKLPEHSNVCYGKDYCPENCPDYVENSNLKTFERFWKLLHNDDLKELLFSRFGIDIEEIYEIKDEKQKEFDNMQRITDSLQAMYSAFEENDE